MKVFVKCLIMCLFIFNNLHCADDLKNVKIFDDLKIISKYGYRKYNANLNGERAIAEKLIKSGDIVFDVGANKGTWSELVLLNDHNISLHMFEPIPDSHNYLLKNFHNPNIHIHPYALSDKEGSVDFFVYANSKGETVLSSLFKRPQLKKVFKEKITVKIKTLDQFCKSKEINHIDYLKIDAEGAEYFIFLGAYEMLSKGNIKTIQFEYGGCNIDSETTLKQMFELLTQYNYSVYCIVPQGLVKINKWNEKLENFQYSNYIAQLNN
jgi:FkbM family methyltransferase